MSEAYLTSQSQTSLLSFISDGFCFNGGLNGIKITTKLHHNPFKSHHKLPSQTSTNPPVTWQRRSVRPFSLKAVGPVSNCTLSGQFCSEKSGGWSEIKFLCKHDETIAQWAARMLSLQVNNGPKTRTFLNTLHFVFDENFLFLFNPRRFNEVPRQSNVVNLTPKLMP